MAISSIDNKYYATLSDYANSTKTNSASNAADVKNAAKPEAIPEVYGSANSAQTGFDSSGFLNYGPKGTYAVPSLADFLESDTVSSGTVIGQSSGQTPGTAEDLETDPFSCVDGNESASQLENVFSSIADGVDEENSRLINDAVARMNGKTGV